ncbi:MAG: branched-chain amino acid ABC transporter permease [Alphaproteobacteria bacterium]|nr:branched-chain amino acid ABC transporter permease [Rhodospirillales bacterium]MCW9045545.1 branched-chain amino acid ABC transporter permease [Alphaproteobacteria bacterium]
MRILFKKTYEDDIRILKHSGYVFWYGLLITALFAAPLFLDDFYLGELAQVYIFAIAGVGLMLLVGYTGQVSLGHAAFLAIGAYSNAWLISKGVPFLISFPLAGVISALAGMIIAIPASRMTGVYLAIATLAFSIIVEQIMVRWESVTGGFKGMTVDAPEIFGYQFWDTWAFYLMCLIVLLFVIVGALNLLRSPTGRAMAAIRDSEVSAQSLGINLAKYKSIAFAISAGVTGLAGALLGHKVNYLSPDSFNMIVSIQLLLMVVVGGLGSIHGAIYGAIFIGALPQLLAILRDYLPPVISQTPGLEPGIFGLILVLFILFEPLGLYGRWRKMKLYFDTFPLYRKSTFKRQKSYLKTERMK